MLERVTKTRPFRISLTTPEENAGGPPLSGSVGGHVDEVEAGRRPWQASESPPRPSSASSGKRLGDLVDQSIRHLT